MRCRSVRLLLVAMLATCASTSSLFLGAAAEWSLPARASGGAEASLPPFLSSYSGGAAAFAAGGAPFGAMLAPCDQRAVRK